MNNKYKKAMPSIHRHLFDRQRFDAERHDG